MDTAARAGVDSKGSATVPATAIPRRKSRREGRASAGELAPSIIVLPRATPSAKMKKTFWGAARATVAAIAIDDKGATDECYAAAGNLMVEFKRRFPGEDPKAGC
jgi:hypothetical protein